MDLFWILLFLLLLTDLHFADALRRLVYSFLLTKRNLKGAKKIHDQQAKWDRFTLAYIKDHTVYPKQYTFYYRFRLIHLYTLIPQYLTVAIVTPISLKWGLIVTFAFCVIKLLSELAVGFRNFAGRISKYDRRYDRFYRKK